jgi:hypothetical protein
MDVARQVFESWKATQPDEDDPDFVGIQSDVGVSAEALDAFESKHGLALPRAFRDLWMLSDGTTTMDRGEMIFWPLDVIDAQVTKWNAPDAAARFIAFADFRLSAVTYMLCYTPSSSAVEAAVWSFDATDRWPSGAKQHEATFDAFLARYVEAAST